MTVSNLPRPLARGGPSTVLRREQFVLCKKQLKMSAMVASLTVGAGGGSLLLEYFG